MCGIGGIIALNKQHPVLKQDILKIADTLHHRGPDDEGFLIRSSEGLFPYFRTHSKYSNSNLSYIPQKAFQQINNSIDFSFIFKRLSILDLSENGHQPMCCINQRYWVVFNGEIYNYLELRETLKEAGFTFRTQTDTEVLLNAYIFWGEQCVSHFNGMWAFCIYDSENNTLFASRDRLGVKPFYFYKSDSTFAFASELKAFPKLSFYKPELNNEAVFSFFVLGDLETQSESLLKGVFELKAGCNLFANLNTNYFENKVYFTTFNTIQTLKTEEQYISELTDLLKQSIKLRLRSDVAVGATLSGGLDSSIIVALAQQQMNDRKLELVSTATYSDLVYDESHWAKQVVEFTNTKWQPCLITQQDFLSNLKSTVYYQDTPLWSASTVAQYLVAKNLKNSGISVILEGQGADELFAGYTSYLWNFRKENIGLSSLNASTIFKTKLKQALKYLPTYIAKPFLQKLFSSQLFLQQDFSNNYQDLLFEKLDELNNTLTQQLNHELLNSRLKTYLKCGDRSSMAHSIESRVPFADDINLITFALNLPNTLKIKDDWQKYALRKAVEGYLPSEIIYRKDKKGYSSPNNVWVQNLEQELSPYTIQKNTSIFNNKAIEANRTKLFNIADKPETGTALKLASFSMWEELFL